MFNIEKRSAIEFLLSCLALNRYQSSTTAARGGDKVETVSRKSPMNAGRPKQTIYHRLFVFYILRGGYPRNTQNYCPLWYLQKVRRYPSDHLDALQCQPYKNSTGFHGHVFLMLRECATV